MSGPAIRRIEASEGSGLRELRLRALADSPGAFGSTLELELAFDDTAWEERARGGALTAESATFVAENRAGLVGMVVVAAAPGDPARAKISGMWVDPAERRSGIGRALLEAAADWALAAGMAELALWVFAPNVGAIGLYEKAGFSRSGFEKPVPRDPSIREIEMVRPLPRA